MTNIYTRYELEARWRHEGRVLAWHYIAEFKSKRAAMGCRDRLVEKPRKVEDYEVRVLEVVWNDCRELRRTVLPIGQLELPFHVSTPGFVSGINYGKMF